MRIGSAGIAPGASPPTTTRTRRPTSTLFTVDIVDPPSWPFARPACGSGRPPWHVRRLAVKASQPLCYHGAAMASATTGVARARERMARALIVLAVAFAVAAPAAGVG